MSDFDLRLEVLRSCVLVLGVIFNCVYVFGWWMVSFLDHPCAYNAVVWIYFHGQGVTSAVALAYWGLRLLWEWPLGKAINIEGMKMHKDDDEYGQSDSHACRKSHAHLAPRRKVGMWQPMSRPTDLTQEEQLQRRMSVYQFKMTSATATASATADDPNGAREKGKKIIQLLLLRGRKQQLVSGLILFSHVFFLLLGTVVVVPFFIQDRTPRSTQQDSATYAKCDLVTLWFIFFEIVIEWIFLAVLASWYAFNVPGQAQRIERELAVVEARYNVH